ncbi:hypothetical protein ARMGADRAFT_729707 [Armillaria gallica]|uniref:Uncharacterized protein n=1 Tax=Armillaria gallica TaxID=47427 RepID=A0A2H3CMQ0_ARMGA|nr:hypothetical protein ARMGADRAFT_729707 [Armillaria gallica]
MLGSPRWRRRIQTVISNRDLYDRPCADLDASDELAVLYGRKSVINKKASSHSLSLNESYQNLSSYLYGDGSDSGSSPPASHDSGSRSGDDALMD